MTKRIRGIWAGVDGPPSPVELAAAEIREAFGPAWEWRRGAPAERNTALYIAAVDALPTLLCWGWRVTTGLVNGGWMVTASREVGYRTIKAQAKAPQLVDAIAELGDKLKAAVAALESEEMAA